MKKNLSGKIDKFDKKFAKNSAENSREKNPSKNSEIREKIPENEIAISVSHVAKTFKLPTEASNSIKQIFINRAHGIKGFREQKVLRDIDFTVKKGDFFGIVGRNGSGKSTLLKIISGIYEPTAGNVEIRGSLVSFIELGVGFNPELTGRENVFLNGAMLGFSKSETEKMYDEIVDFAELSEFMDQKLKNYSSGMQVRLAFSCAIQAKSDILVLDEVLAVGDEAFQKKCNDFFAEIKKDKNKTIILVTHSMDAVKKYCNRAILIRDGKIEAAGNPIDVANKYSVENIENAAKSNKGEIEQTSVVANFSAKILSKKPLSEKDKLSFEIEYETTENVDTYVAFSIVDNNNTWIYNDNSLDFMNRGKGKFALKYEADLSALNDRVFRLMISVRDKNGNMLYLHTDEPVISVARTDIKTASEKDSATGIINRTGVWETAKK